MRNVGSIFTASGALRLPARVTFFVQNRCLATPADALGRRRVPMLIFCYICGLKIETSPMAIDISKVPSPCYVLDEQLLRNNLRLIDRVRRESGAEIIMAFKAFAFWPSFSIFRECGFDCATASSLSEAMLARHELGQPAHTYSPAYTDAEFDAICQCSSHITFNSLSQYERFAPRARAAGHAISLGLRINPESSDVATALYNPCAPGSRMGITAANMPAELPADIEGLHFHALCESDSTDLQKTLGAVEQRFARWLPKVRWVNMGGGHLMTRKGYDTDLLVRLIRDFARRWDVRVILEPGSAFTWQTGVLVSDVEDVVENGGISTAIVNVSFAAHMPDCLEMPYKPRIAGAHHDPVDGLPTYRIGGNSCLSGDYIGSWSFDRPLRVGDKIVFEDMIHYTVVKTTMFNGLTHPSLAIWDDAKGLRVVRTFGYDDYRSRLG